MAGISMEFLQRRLSAPRARRQISSRATGTKDSMRNISQAALLAIDVPAIEPADHPGSSQHRLGLTRIAQGWR